MFDRYMIVENTLRNVSAGGETYAQMGIRFPHHCGIWVSIIEQLELELDGQPVPADRMSLEIHGNRYRVIELELEQKDRWNFGEIGILWISIQEPLKPGVHEIRLKMGLRVSFLEWLLTGSDEKQMVLMEA